MLDWLKERQMDRRIPNFSPNKNDGNFLVKKRIRPFLLVMFSLLILEIIGFSIIWYFSGTSKVKIFGIALILLHALSSVTFIVIFDNGAAQRLKKDNFKVNGKKVSSGHTYYYALKKSGFIRLFINVVIILIIMSITLSSFII